MKRPYDHLACTVVLIIAAASMAFSQQYIGAIADRAAPEDLGRKTLLILEDIGGSYVARDSIPLLQDEFGLQFYVTGNSAFTLYRSLLTSADSLRLTRYRIEDGKLVRESWINIDADGTTCCPLCVFLRSPDALWMDCDRGAIEVDLTTMKIRRNRGSKRD